MKIVVLVKHVPDVQSQRRLADGVLVRGEDDVLNELDENAVEAAVQLAEAHGGEVMAVTMGPEDAADGLLAALQRGADRALHVCDDRLAGSDVVSTAKVLAAAIRSLGEVDLVLTGMASLDGLTSMLPGALAAVFGWPSLTLASSLEVAAGRATIVRSADGFTDRLSAPLPAVVSVTDQVNEPRYPNFAALKAARKKPLDTVDLDDLGLAPQGLGSATAHVAATEAASRGGGPVLSGPTAAAELVAFLRERGLVAKEK
ncbi:electron transfer flavoprotein beta subunit/FixA family protein [Buchananella hordeovulneris]|uniref:electron transfer flavoprotein subunit beta/FixA family protein n=1 Tax=Buchananella hordeovulneris TaxID=52770 RepID=UPI000F60451F|nr:electron transfer flavoprotein subunit beta/FixA family protein [Buchananella hordeovulneris]RRD53101.1 electron transfer flavoprotein beta subunit/FixA family protein [Buchananella hordeovulneris]